MTMTNLERIRKGLSPARRKKIEARAAQLVSEEMTLQELRQARKLTQVRMAKALGITQDGVSRLEKRSDLLLSTLRKSVQAMGGTLSLVAEFPDRDPVVLSGIRRRRRKGQGRRSEARPCLGRIRSAERPLGLTRFGGQVDYAVLPSVCPAVNP